MATEFVRIEGLKGVLDVLKQLPPEVTSKRGGPVRASLRKAAQVLQKEAQANVRKIVLEPNLGSIPSLSTGALEKSISVLRRRFVGGEKYTVGISKLKRARADTKANRRSRTVGKEYEVLPPTFYAWFLEFGTEKMRAHPFMRPAFATKKEEAVNVFTVDLNKRITAIVAKLARANRVQS